MAQGPNITGLTTGAWSTWYNYAGPFKSSTNNYYIFSKDGTTATTLQAYKAAGDPLSTAFSSAATKTGFTTAILQVSAYQVGDVIHLGIAHGTSSTSVNFSYQQYNMATDTFLATTESIASLLNTNNPGAIGVVVLSNGNVVVSYQSALSSSMGTNYSHVSTRTRTGTNTWNTAQVIDPNTTASYQGGPCALGASDSVHIIYSVGTNNTQQRTLNSSSVLQTASTNVSASGLGPLGGGFSFSNSGTQVLFYINASGA